MEKDIKDILKNFFAGNFITIIYILTGIITARILGPVGKGKLISALYWPMMLAWIFNLGIGYANTYFSAKDTKNINAIISNSIVLSLPIGIVAIIIGFFSVPYLIKDASLHNIVRWSLLIIPFSLLGNYLVWIFNGLKRYTLFNVARVIHPSFYLFTLIVTIRHLTVIKAVIFSLSGTFLAFLVLFTFIAKNIGFQFNFNPSLLKKSLKLGLKSYIGSFAMLGNKRADQAILIAMLSPSLIAFYGMAVNITELLLQISNAIGLTVIPSTASLNIKASKNLILKRMKFTALWLLIGGVILFFTAKYIIILLYGSAFLPTLLPVRILVPGTIFLGLSAICEQGLKGKAFPLLSSASQISALALNIVLLIILIPSINIVGAAIASDIAYFVLFSLDAIFLVHIFRIKQI